MISLVLRGISGVASFVGLIVMLGAIGGGGDTKGIMGGLSVLVFIWIIVWIVAFILTVSILFLPYVVESMFDFSLSGCHCQVGISIGKTDRKLRPVEQSTNLTFH